MLQRLAKLASLCLLALCFAPAASAQLLTGTPTQLQGVGVDEKPGQKIDLDLEFIAPNGYPVPLREFFHQDRPVLLTLVYYQCPMLCNRLMNGLTEALRDVPWTPGKEFELVTISIDPTETYKLASQRRQLYLAQYDRPAPGWHFLADHQGNVQKLAEQVGFRYRYDKKIEQYAHAAVFMILSPDGTISRYLYGLKFNPRDIRLAVTEASDFKFSQTVERLMLFCFHYDPKEQSYVPFAMNVMRTGGLLVLLTLTFIVWRLLRQERHTQAATGNLV